MKRPLLTLLLLCAGAWPALAQDPVSVARQNARSALRGTSLGALSPSFSSLNSDGELSGGDLEFDNRPDLLVSPKNLLIPFSPELVEDTLSLRIELELGVLNARIEGPIGDRLYIRSRWEVYGGGAGVGPSLHLPFGLRLQPLLQLGLSWVSNRTSFRGPDALAAEVALGDIVFDVHALYGSFGGSCALRHPGLELGPLTLGWVLRYDLRRLEVLDAEKDAITQPLTSQWLTARADLRGPLWSNEEWSVDWLASVGYRRYFDELERALEVSDYYVLSAGFALGLPEKLRQPLVNEVRATGTYFIGEDVRGWTAGLSAGF